MIKRYNYVRAIYIVAGRYSDIEQCYINKCAGAGDDYYIWRYSSSSPSIQYFLDTLPRKRT